MFPVYSNSILYGSSQAGKSSFLGKLIANRDEIFPLPPQCIIYINKDTVFDEIKRKFTASSKTKLIDLNWLCTVYRA